MTANYHCFVLAATENVYIRIMCGGYEISYYNGTWRKCYRGYSIKTVLRDMRKNIFWLEM